MSVVAESDAPEIVARMRSGVAPGAVGMNVSETDARSSSDAIARVTRSTTSPFARRLTSSVRPREPVTRAEIATGTREFGGGITRSRDWTGCLRSRVCMARGRAE